MTMNPFAELVLLIIKIYVHMVLLRFFLQYLRADFYNPLSQFVVKITDPFIRPLRKIIPGFGGIDFSSLVLAWLVYVIGGIAVDLLNGSFNANILKILIIPVLQVINSCFGLYIFLIFIRAILSWFQMGYNPILMVFGQLTDPLLSKCRKLLPPMSGFDFSPIVALIGLFFVQSLINYYIFPLVGMLIT